MIGVWWGERKALEPLDWLGLDGMDFTTQWFFFLFSVTTSHIFLSSPIGCKDVRGRECGLIPRELIALT